MGLIGALRAFATNDAHWGRILAVESRTWRRVTLRVEVHWCDLDPFERRITTWLPKGVEPQAGQDVYVAPVRGQFAGVEHPYRIHWRRAPQYGISNPTPEQRRAYEQSVAAEVTRSRGLENPSDPKWQLDYITNEHVAGRMSDADFARYSQALKPYL